MTFMAKHISVSTRAPPPRFMNLHRTLRTSRNGPEDSAVR